MNGPVWLIAGREIRTYVSTASFWIALVIGPLFMVGALALASASPPSAVRVQVIADDAAQAAALVQAVSEAAAADGQKLVVSQAPAKIQVRLAALGPGKSELRIDAAAPLSPAARMLVLKTFEAIQAQSSGGNPVGADPGAGPALLLARPAPQAAADPRAISRLAIMIMLWLTLTGSLGMLLQAVVRERTNRALETLLAAARPWEIVTGKLMGVGVVSVGVVGAWLGSAAAAALFTPGAAGQVAGLLRALGDPVLLLYSAAIYILAFAFYGLTTIAIGARARDSASAQNLSRPMFVTLLVAFFVTLAAGGTASPRLAWLVYAPPFTPFMLLARPYPPGAQALALLLLAASAALAAWAAVRSLDIAAGAVSRQMPRKRSS
jgi:ABC-2 type transport system permease protein